jgi:hypothetical protein
MANAADYLRLDTTQLVNSYKLRTFTTNGRSFVATNITSDYKLSVSIVPTVSYVSVTPSSFTLEPNASITVTVTYNVLELDLFSAGTLTGELTMTVSAESVVVPEIPQAPPPPPVPPAPRQIVSRVQIIPSTYTFSEVNEIRQFAAQLFVDDTLIPNATFAWSLENDSADAFTITNENVKLAQSKNNATANVRAQVVSPGEYSQTTGLSTITANIPTVIDDSPTTGNLIVNIVQASPTMQISPNVTVFGPSIRGESITSTKEFVGITPGNYIVSAEVVTSTGGIKYIPNGGETLYVGAGERKEITITYFEEEKEPEYSIEIISITPSTSLQEGDTFTVTAQTKNEGTGVSLGNITFTATNTTVNEISQQTTTTGIASATFTANSGIITITASNTSAGSTSRTLIAEKIEITSPTISVSITDIVNSSGRSLLNPSTPLLMVGDTFTVVAQALVDGFVDTTRSIRFETNTNIADITVSPVGGTVRQTFTVIGGDNITIRATTPGITTAPAIQTLNVFVEDIVITPPTVTIDDIFNNNNVSLLNTSPSLKAGDTFTVVAQTSGNGPITLTATNTVEQTGIILLDSNSIARARFTVSDALRSGGVISITASVPDGFATNTKEIGVISRQQDQYEISIDGPRNMTVGEEQFVIARVFKNGIELQSAPITISITNGTTSGKLSDTPTS